MDELCTRVAELCDSVLERLGPGRAREQVDAARARLHEPLRVAVAGRVKAGKSTLVNALLRRAVAATAVGECTKIVTWFRYAPLERAELLLRQPNDAVRLALTEAGCLPEALYYPREEVESITVWLSNDSLLSMTIVDTPGLASANEQLSDASEKLLGADSKKAMAEADAVVYLFTQDARADDLAVLESFRSQFGGLRTSAFNAVGVLSRADKIGSGSDPLSAATALAASYASELRASLSTVVPVVGLLAETAEARLPEQDLVNLRRLARLDAEDREVMLLSGDLFLRQECDVLPEDRERLLRTLDLFGIKTCLELIDAGAGGSRTIANELLERSGIEELREQLGNVIEPRADVLKATAGMRVLERVAYSRAGPGETETLNSLRSAIDDLRLEPAMHRIDEVWALQEAVAGDVDLPSERLEELERLVQETDDAVRLGLDVGAEPAAMGDAALGGMERWSVLANTAFATTAQRRVAEITRRSYEMLWERATQPQGRVV